MASRRPPKDIGARHAGEIEYVFGTLDSVKGVKWTDADRALSSAIMAYWTNFAKSGDPNGRDYVRPQGAAEVAAV